MTESKATKTPTRGTKKPAARSRNTQDVAPQRQRRAAKSTAAFGTRMRGSLTEQIEGLHTGESIARAARVAQSSTNGASSKESKFYDSNNSSYCTAIKRVKQSPANKGREFRIERLKSLTSDGSIAMVLMLTRMS